MGHFANLYTPANLYGTPVSLINSVRDNSTRAITTAVRPLSVLPAANCCNYVSNCMLPARAPDRHIQSKNERDEMAPLAARPRDRRIRLNGLRLIYGPLSRVVSFIGSKWS